MYNWDAGRQKRGEFNFSLAPNSTGEASEETTLSFLRL